MTRSGEYDQVVLDFLEALADMTPEQIAEKLASLGVTSNEAAAGMANLAETIRHSSAEKWLDGK